jgi:hypothetical protein
MFSNRRHVSFNIVGDIAGSPYADVIAEGLTSGTVGATSVGSISRGVAAEKLGPALGQKVVD